MGKAIKLTAMGILLCVALATAILSKNTWHWFIAGALMFSWIGDAMLARLEAFTRNIRDPFMVGMGSFAVAQIFYIIAFWQSILGMPGLHVRIPGELLGAELVTALVPVYLLIGVFFWVWMIMRTDNPGSLKIGTLVYCCLLSSMAGVAASAAFTGAFIVWQLIAGGALFMLSDGIIAAHMFAGRIENERKYDLLVWGTYLPAQILLYLGASQLY